MVAAVIATPAPVCHRLHVRGQVQGVGFRPFVYRLATELGLSGWVRNDTTGVEIEIEGEAVRLRLFEIRLQREAPVLARVDGVERQVGLAGLRSSRARGFRIDSSTTQGVTATTIGPDVAVCDACLRELFDPRDRRYRYPFINCTHCGPRYTLTARLPYDRAHTSMARFQMCGPCAAEYHNPRDRRFHAQPDACADCGPRLALHDADGRRLAARDLIAETMRRIAQGEIVAIKGLGGFHLACDARNTATVARLRQRKQRDAKPFAVMLANPQSTAGLAVAEPGDVALLLARERPIVLLDKDAGCDAALPGVAPDMGCLGVMLPYTPLHYLLFHQAAGCPDGVGWLKQVQSSVLVMTSANPGGEPLVIDNEDPLARLQGIADAFLLHDRDILIRCDDSVVYRTGASGAAIRAPQFVRRARGYTPGAIRLAHSGPAVLACGGHLKNTICVTRGDEAFLSQYIGDLDNAAACLAMEETVSHLIELLEVEPQCVAHDGHPDFFSSRFAARFAGGRNIPLIGVQHHHAHIAAVLAEHGVQAPVLGLALDGFGLGTDGGIWGGELLKVSGARFERMGCLLPLALPGGDRAAMEPWRMAASALHALGRGGEIAARFPRGGAILRQMLDRGVNAPMTSSAGRLFDAAAGLLGVAQHNAFEAQAAMQLEALAQGQDREVVWMDGWQIDDDGRLDLLPLLARLAGETDPSKGAALFHATFAAALADWVGRAARRTGIATVALGGGCFLNRILSNRLRDDLIARGLTVLEARQAPPNDGGLSLGQAWVAMQRADDARPNRAQSARDLPPCV